MHWKLWLRVPLVAAALVLATHAHADEANGKKKGRPHQVIPTGAEDARPPTPAEVAAEAELEAITSRSTDGLVEVLHVDGTVAMDLEGRFQHVLVRTENADGSAGFGCSTHPGEKVVMPVALPARRIGPASSGAAGVVRLPAQAPRTPAVEEK
jgi:hypothetical protein